MSAARAVAAVSTAALVVGLTGACSSRYVIDNGVVQTTSRHRLSTAYESRDFVYLRVAGGAPDAVLYAEPDQWADVTATLDFGQCVLVIDNPPGNFIQVRTTGLGIDQQGWAWAAAFSRTPPREYPPGEEAWEKEGASFDTTSGRVKRRHPPSAIERVGEHEQALAAGLGDSERLNKRFKAFGVDGGLLVE